MHTAAIVLLILSACGVGLGMFPCVGWMNWFALPLCGLTVLLSVIGLVTDKDPETHYSRNVNHYLCALIGGCLLGVAGFVRWVLGGGLI